MFEWKIDNYLLMNERKERAARMARCGFRSDNWFQKETEMSRDEKIAFIDGQTEGEMTYILGLGRKFEEERSNLPLAHGTKVNTNSFKAWLKRNDTRNLFDREYNYGKLCSRNMAQLEASIYNINNRKKTSYDKYSDIVDEYFHRLLNKLADEEEQHYKEHNEYCKLEKEAHEYIKRFGSFGIKTFYRASEGVMVTTSSGEERKPTTEELSAIVNKGRKVEAYIQELSEGANGAA